MLLSGLLLLITCAASRAGAPVFETDTAVLKAVENVFLRMRCSARGDPEPFYTWFNEAGEELGPQSYPPVEIDSGRRENITFSDLIFNVTLAAHTGLYACTAENEHGLRSKIYNLTIDRNPGEEKLEIVNITSTSVTFRLNLNRPEKTLDIEYIEKVDNRTLYRAHSSGNEIVFANLIPSGFYQFNFSLRQDPRKWNATVVLLPSQPEVIFRHLSDGVLSIEWFRTFDDVMRKTIDKYRLQYLSVQQMRGNYWVRSSCNTTIEIPYCSPSRFTLASLERKVYYEILLSAHTSAGYGTPFRNKVYLS